jgi:cysteinyl-tRNA synthetase
LLFDEKITKLWLLAGVKLHMEQETIQAPLEIRVLAEKRKEAKWAKDWAKADKLRDEISQAGRVVKDTPEWFDLSQV